MDTRTNIKLSIYTKYVAVGILIDLKKLLTQ